MLGFDPKVRGKVRVMSISIILVDDHHLVRHAVKNLLEAEPDFMVIGEEFDGLKAIGLIERLTPDIVLSDILLRGVNGFEVSRQARLRSPRTNSIILSAYANETYVQEALRSGAPGYVLKSSQSSELLEAVREVAGGRRYLPPSLTRRGVDLQRTRARTEDVHLSLTRREREVLQLAVDGLSSAGIAWRLSISRRTAETHRANMMRKLGIRTQMELLRYALRSGILKVES